MTSLTRIFVGNVIALVSLAGFSGVCRADMNVLKSLSSDPFIQATIHKMAERRGLTCDFANRFLNANAE